MIDLASKELSARVLFTNSWKLLFKNIKNYVLLLLSYFLAMVVIWWAVFGVLALFWWLNTANTNIDDYSSLGLIMIGIAIIIAIVFLVYIALIYAISMLHMIHQQLIGNIISTKDAIQYARSGKLSKFFKLWIIKTIYLIWLTILFIIPGLIYAMYWVFTSQAFIVEWSWYPQALDQSKSLVKGRRWKLFGKFFVIGLIYIGIFIIIWVPTVFIIAVLTKSGPMVWQGLPMWISIIGDLLQQIVSQFVWIAWGITIMMMYLNWKQVFSSQIQTTVIKETISESTNPFDK